MTNEEKIVVAASAAAVVFGTVSYLQIAREERRKRAQIRKNALREIQAIHDAGEVVKEKLKAGKYDYRGVIGIVEDLEFETIVAFNK